MKLTKVLLLTSMMMLIPLWANSAITVDQSTSKEFVMNQGFSEDTYEIITVEKNRGVGKEYYTAAERRDRELNPVLRFFRKLYSYTDPGAQDFSFYHHNNNPVPVYSDL